MREELRIIVSGGGTGGHIFPAVSIANAIKSQHPEAEILFVGSRRADGDAACSGCRLSYQGIARFAVSTASIC